MADQGQAKDSELPEGEEESSRSSGLGDLRSLLRQLVSPVIERVEEQVSKQIDQEVTDRFDELLATRMSTIDRAIGDLDRHLNELSARLDRLERHGLGDEAQEDGSSR
jgi:hypothetical protein